MNVQVAVRCATILSASAKERPASTMLGRPKFGFRFPPVVCVLALSICCADQRERRDHSGHQFHLDLLQFIQPVTRQLGINKKMSWHTFRHTFSSILKSNGEDVKVVQELLRHSTARMTLDTYTQALGPHKRAAQSKLVGMIRPKERVFSVYRDKEGVSG